MEARAAMSGPCGSYELARSHECVIEWKGGHHRRSQINGSQLHTQRGSCGVKTKFAFHIF
jgi:hypothetical protein